MITVAAVFADGKRFEDYVTELDMIEIDTEFPLGFVPDAEDATLNTLYYRVKEAGLSPAQLVIAEGSGTVLSRAFDRANRKGECLFYMVLSED